MLELFLGLGLVALVLRLILELVNLVPMNSALLHVQSTTLIAGVSDSDTTPRRIPVVYTAPNGRKAIGHATPPPGGGKRWAFEAFGLESFRPRIARLTF